MPLSWDKRAAFIQVYLPVMKVSPRHKLFLSVAAFCLFAGMISYGFFGQIPVPHFIAGHFADIAWCVSLYLCTIILSEKKLLGFADRLALLVLPFLTETLQAFGFMHGTFDWYDMLSYSAVLLVLQQFFPYLIFKPDETKHEKI